MSFFPLGLLFTIEICLFHLARQTKLPFSCPTENQEQTFDLSPHLNLNITSNNHFPVLENISIIWSGDDPKVLLVVTLNSTVPSQLYRSLDGGANFENVTSLLHGYSVVKVIQNPRYKKQVLFIADDGLVSSKTVFFVTSDGGRTLPLPMSPALFRLNASTNISFHPTNHSWVLSVVNDENHKAFVSTTGGIDWTLISNDIIEAQWGSEEETSETIYYLKRTNDKSNSRKVSRLMKTTNLGVNSTVIADNVNSFVLNGKFLYASIYLNNDKSKSILRVSTSGGRNWNEAQLPTMIEDQFYRILDISDGMVFIHVDQPGDTGHGILYTSDTDGIIFSESLKKHLYPNEGVTDFYKVNSVRGVYITSQLNSDHSIQTMVTFNRGSTWHPLRKPNGLKCPEKSTPCFLQVSYHFSAVNGVHVPIGPLSLQSAVGVILTHGHVGQKLMNGPPDVFVSLDGGYNWTKALTGPHLYAVADHGGLLVAVAGGFSSAPPIKSLKFSTDAGQSWCSYRFSNQSVTVIGLLTDPEESFRVILWGRITVGNATEWQITVVDFEMFFRRHCKEPKDFEEFLAHNEATKGEPSRAGCLLGTREIFRKLKPNSRCFLGRSYQVKKSKEHCNCTRDDYECDFGYHRSGSSNQCVENPIFKAGELDVCLNGEEMEIVTTGYRKIPGDLCEAGFDPGQHFPKDMKRKCVEGDKTLLRNFRGSPTSTLASAILSILVILVMMMVMCMSVFFIKKCRQITSSPLVYRYSRLEQEDLIDITCANVDEISQTSADVSLSEDMNPATLLIDTTDSTTVELKPKSVVKSLSETGKAFYFDESDDELLQ